MSIPFVFMSSHVIVYMLLTLGTFGQRHLDSQILSQISGGILDGTSLSGTSLNALIDTLSYRNVVGIEVDNYSRWAMTHPISFPDRGVVTIPPRDIHPGEREAMLARKTSFTATGTQGTVSWLIDNRRVIVMWEDPFNLNFYSNTLAVGIIEEDAHTASMYDTMMKGSGNFTRGVYDQTIHTIEYCDGALCVTGTMGTSHKNQIHIQVIPVILDNMARTLEKYLPDNIIG